MISPQRLINISASELSYEMNKISIESQEAGLFKYMAVQIPPASNMKLLPKQDKNFEHSNSFVAHCMSKVSM
jgi:hypothetical protein